MQYYWSGHFPHLSVLVEHADDLVSQLEDVPPVKVGKASLPILFWPTVQEVEDVFGGKLCVLHTLVQEVSHCGVCNRILKGQGETDQICQEMSSENLMTRVCVSVCVWVWVCVWVCV